jgi:hypothetical protein
MKKRFRIPLLPALLLTTAASLYSQQLTIQPEAGKQTVLSRVDIEALPHSKITTGPRILRSPTMECRLKPCLKKRELNSANR